MTDLRGYDKPRRPLSKCIFSFYPLVGFNAARILVHVDDHFCLIDFQLQVEEVRNLECPHRCLSVAASAEYSSLMGECATIVLIA